MKRIVCSLITAAALFLSSCATDPATGRRGWSPEMDAAFNRIGVSTLNAAEAAFVTKFYEALNVKPSGK